MNDAVVAMADRIDERLLALGLTDRKASMLAVGKPDLIRDIRRGRRPIGERLGRLAAVLETSVDFLQGATESPASGAEPVNPLRALVPQPQEMLKDVPVYGTALGSEHSYGAEFGGDVAVEQTDLNTGEVVDRFRRPPNLINRRDIYGLYVAGSSMEPAFESGQGILIDPKRPPSARDYVVVYLRDNTDHSDVGVLIKRLVRRSASFIELQQYNPPVIFRLDARRYREVHRVMPWDEAFGL